MKQLENFDRENRYLRAKERVEALKKFYTDLIWYIVVVGFLAWINYYTNGWGYMWFLWVAFGWGIGLVFHALKAFQLSPFMNKQWEERKIQEFMEEEENEDLVIRNRWE